MYSNIFIISGPSGAGEDSIIDGVAALMPIERVINTTTRSELRPGESQGNPYYFITHEQFAEGIHKGDFVEYAELHNHNFYGVTKAEIHRVAQSKKTGIWKMDYKGVITVKKIFPEIRSILITVPSLDVLETRIRRRGGVSETYIQDRLDYAKEWLKHTDIYDYTIINAEGELKTSIEQVRSLLQQA